MVDAEAGTVIEVEIEGSGDGMISVTGPSGLLVQRDVNETGIEETEVGLPADGVHFVQVELGTGAASAFTLRSNVELIPVVDFDDGRGIAIGETITGSIDYRADSDWYTIDLQEGDRVRISTDSITVDTTVYVYTAETRDNQFEIDDDSGGGLFDINAELIFQAPHTGEFFIAVADVWGDEFGGYYLSVERAPDST